MHIQEKNPITPSRFLIIAIFATALALSYVHQEVSLLEMSYRIKMAEEHASLALDRNQDLLYNVSKLESPGRLKAKLNAHRVKLVMPRREQLLVLAKERSDAKTVLTASARSDGPLRRIMNAVLSGRRAEASDIDALKPR